MASFWEKIKKNFIFVNFKDKDKHETKVKDKEKKSIFKFADYKLFILALLGIFLMVFGSVISSTEKEGLFPKEEEEDSPAIIQKSVRPEQKLQEELEEILSYVQGVSHPSVFINFYSGPQKVFASDYEENLRETEEQDGDGGVRDTSEINKREEVVIKRGSQGEEIPLIIEEISPKVQGVLIVAEGVENPTKKSQVLDAVKAVLDLPPHRIVVLPRDK